MPLSARIEVVRGSFNLSARIEAGDGETLAVVGPNGAGKSTMVEALAGSVPLDDGEIVLDGRAVHTDPPERRRIGVTFQDGLLFPHLNAGDNVAFPIRARGAGRAEAARRARVVLARVASDIAPEARVGALSGGQRQKVALARALAAEPRLLLLDEPLASVDVGARGGLRSLLRREIAGFDGPCVLVSHDPVDVLTLADRVAILEGGRVTQTGTPEEILRAPRTSYAADLVGVNMYVGRLEPTPGGGGVLHTGPAEVAVAWPDGLPVSAVDDVLAVVRPIDVAVHLGRPEGSPSNVFHGPVREIAIHGERARVRIDSVPAISAEITLGSVARLGLEPGSVVYASLKAVEVRLMVPEGAPDTL